MAHFAQLNQDNVVTEVIVVNNATLDNLPFPESEPVGIEFCKALYGIETRWRQTSYNASFRKNYAGIGFTFDPVLDAFIPPKPYPSWLLNTTTCQWEAPVPYPTDGKAYTWDEATLSWVEVPPYPVEIPPQEDTILTSDPAIDAVIEPATGTSSDGVTV